MKIVSKKGIEIEVSVTGYSDVRDSQKIEINFLAPNGKKVKSVAKIVRNEKVAEGFAFNVGGQSARIECAISEVEKAISELPEAPKPKFVKVMRDVTVSDYETKEEKWEVRNKFSGGDEMTIPSNSYRVGDSYEYSSSIFEMLDKAGIKEIEIEKALDLFAEKKSQKPAKKESNGFSNIFNDDLLEEGLDQALENAGIPKFLFGKGKLSGESDAFEAVRENVKVFKVNPADVLNEWIKIENEPKPKTIREQRESGWSDRYMKILDTLIEMGYGHYQDYGFSFQA